MRNKNRFCPPVPALACLLLALLLSFQQNRLREEALAGRIAPAVLRFHILANSDSRADQQIKLAVRSLILDWASSLLPEDSGKEETAALFLEKKEQLEALAGDYLNRQGAGYGARLSLVRDYFPSRTYGPFRFPRGWYDAVRVTLGEGRGHNWWCILYPRFCFVDPVCQEGSQTDQDTKKSSQPGPDVKGISQPGSGTDKGNQRGQGVTDSESQRQDTKEIDRLRQDIKEDDYLALKDNRPVLDLRLKCLPGFSFIRPLPDR